MLTEFCRPQGMSTWVDDIGIDLRGFTSAEVAKRAVVTFLELKEGLVSRGLEIEYPEVRLPGQ